MDKVVRNFLWTGFIDSKKLISIARNKCCLPKENSGIGIKSLKLMNKDLLRKLSWKFLINDDFVFVFFALALFKAIFLLLEYIMFAFQFGRLLRIITSVLWRNLVGLLVSIHEFDFGLIIGWVPPWLIG